MAFRYFPELDCGDKREWGGGWRERLDFCFLWETLGKSAPQGSSASRWRVSYHQAAKVFSGKLDVPLAWPGRPQLLLNGGKGKMRAGLSLKMG